MANRTRKIKVQFYLSEEEYDFIQQKMDSIGTTNFSAFARKMIIDGYLIQYSLEDLKQFNRELGRLNGNIYQITKRTNETRNIYEQDVSDLRKLVKKSTAQAKEATAKIIYKLTH